MHPLMTWSGHDPARRSKAEANVRYWHEADMLDLSQDVGF